MAWLAKLATSNPAIKSWHGSLVKIAQIIATERGITFLTRGVDGLMIYMLAKYGIFWEVVVCTPLYFALCVTIIFFYDKWLSEADPLCINYFHSLKGQNFKKPRVDVVGFVRWIFLMFVWGVKSFSKLVMKSRKTIFWLGSIFVLDPDLVTLLNRKGEKTTIGDFFKITLPSCVLSIVFWTVIYWLAVNGYKYFSIHGYFMRLIQWVVS